MSADGNNGDQFFNATFGAPPSNGIPEFQPLFMRQKTLGQNVPVSTMAPSPTHPPPPTHPPQQHIDGRMLPEQFAALGVTTPTHGNGRLKGRNPDASEFVPKSSGLTHSSSTPSFASFSQMSTMGGHTIATPVTHLPTGVTLSAGTSPLGSPGMSPQGSPLINRRTRSPIPRSQTSTSTPTSASGLVQENVGGTTYFYTQEELENAVRGPVGGGVVLPNFTMYPGILPHVAHMKLKSNMPGFFMPDEMKVEILNRHVVSHAQIDPEQSPDIPQEVDNYHNLFPLELPSGGPLQKPSTTFGYPTTVYRATNTKDSLLYTLRRIHGFRLVNTKCMSIIDIWKKMSHSNIVQLREVFTTKAFGDHSMVFVYDFHPGSETLMSRHFNNPAVQMNGYSNPYNLDGSARPYSAGKVSNAKGGQGGGNSGGTGNSAGSQQAGLLPESLIWSYIVQLSSALRTIHTHRLACRVMDPTKILLTDKSRIRLNCVGIFDVLSFDASQQNPMAMIQHYQQEDLISLGKVVLALACNSVIGIQREHMQTSLDLVSRNYSADLKNLILYLLTNPQRLRSVNDIMPMIGARFYTQLDAAQLRNDVLENELSKEVENGRLFRLLAKFGVINDRPEFNLDPSWSETGDRYMLKLFRDYLFHQVDENGAPWLDLAHIVQCLNKLDAGVPEKVCLMSRDEQSVLVVTYADLKQCFESAINDLLQAAHHSSTAAGSGTATGSVVPGSQPHGYS